jgi:hypothetical protein
MKVRKPMSDQSTLWGATLEFWDRRGVILMVVGGALGFIALGATVASSFILWKVAGLAQSDLEKVTRAHETEIGEQKKLTANIEKASEDLRKANLLLEAEIAPRRLTLPQMQKIADILVSKYAGRSVKVGSYAMDAESMFLATQIKDSLEGARMSIVDGRASTTSLNGFVLAIHVDGPDADFAAEIRRVLSEAGLTVAPKDKTMPPVAGGGMTMVNPNEPAVAASVFVGIKPIKR